MSKQSGLKHRNVSTDTKETSIKNNTQRDYFKNLDKILLSKSKPFLENYLDTEIAIPVNKWAIERRDVIKEMAKDIVKQAKNSEYVSTAIIDFIKTNELFTQNLYEEEKDMTLEKLKKSVQEKTYQPLIEHIETNTKEQIKPTFFAYPKINNKETNMDEKLAKKLEQEETIDQKQPMKGVEAQKIWDEHKKLIKKEVSHWKPIMVLSNDSSDTIVLKTIETLAKNKNSDLAKFLTEKPDHQNVNTEVNAAIKNALNNGTLKDISPIDLEENKVKYEHGNGSLIQEEVSKNKFKFKVEKNFTGILRVQRINKENDNLLEDHVDIIEYKNGEPIAVTLATTGESRISDISLIQQQVGISVAASPQKIGIEVSTRPQQHNVPNTLVVANKNKKNRGRTNAQSTKND